MKRSLSAFRARGCEDCPEAAGPTTANAWSATRESGYLEHLIGAEASREHLPKELLSLPSLRDLLLQAHRSACSERVLQENREYLQS